MVSREFERTTQFESAVKDGGNPYFRGPDYKPSATIFRSIRPVIRELFPVVEKTSVPELIEQAIDHVSEYCRTDPDGTRHLMARGSWITRQILGTPQNYWELNERFRQIRSNTDLIGDSKLAQRVVEHLAVGPDVDIMYLLRDGVSDSDVFSELQTWVHDINIQQESQGLRLQMKQVSLSDFNGPDDTRVYSVITFEKETRYGWKNILRIDFGKEPREYELSLDGRLSGYLPFNDLCSTAKIQKRTDGGWRLRIDKDDMDVVRYEPNNMRYHGIPKQILFTAAARFLTHQVWWPKGEPLESFLYRQVNVHQYSERKYSQWYYPSFSAGMSAFNVRPDQGLVIKQREEDILGWYLLGMTADPYQWLEYARSVGVLQRTKLGAILTPNMQEALLREECNVRDSEMGQFVHDFPNQVREALARDYRHYFPGMYHDYIGPLRFVSDLVVIGALPADTPVTIATFLDLVDPVSYLASLQASETDHGQVK